MLLVFDSISLLPRKEGGVLCMILKVLVKFRERLGSVLRYYHREAA